MGGIVSDIAEWLAPVATMIAAMMTASNIGARVTGWGFVVFTLGSIAWTIVGLGSGQTSLIAANGFLILVNLLGVWRWLGRQRAYEDGAKSAKKASRRSTSPTLFPATGIAGMPVVDRTGTSLGKAVEALIECQSGQISYVVVSSTCTAGIGEDLRAVNGEAIIYYSEKLQLKMDRKTFEDIAPITSEIWPASV